MDNESTPIESVQIDELEKSHQSEAEAALAELSGGAPSVPQKPMIEQMTSPSHNWQGDQLIEEDDDEVVSENETMTDLLLNLLLTAAVVAVSVFALFSPKIRVLLEPVIGTGYMALIIRSIMVGVLAVIPRLLFV